MAASRSDWRISLAVHPGHDRVGRRGRGGGRGLGGEGRRGGERQGQGGPGAAAECGEAQGEAHGVSGPGRRRKMAEDVPAPQGQAAAAGGVDPAPCRAYLCRGRAATRLDRAGPARRGRDPSPASAPGTCSAGRPPAETDTPHVRPPRRAIFGTTNDRALKRYQARVPAINALEPQMQALSDEALAGQTAEFRDRLAKGETPGRPAARGLRRRCARPRSACSASAISTCR